jgi:hypothetical protein
VSGQESEDCDPRSSACSSLFLKCCREYAPEEDEAAGRYARQLHSRPIGDCSALLLRLQRAKDCDNVPLNVLLCSCCYLALDLHLIRKRPAQRRFLYSIFDLSLSITGLHILVAEAGS